MLIPATVQIIHALDHHHEHEVIQHSISDNDIHFSEECSLCELILDNSGLLQDGLQVQFLKLKHPELVHNYSFVKDYHHLFYSLRGPPSL